MVSRDLLPILSSVATVVRLRLFIPTGVDLGIRLTSPVR
jgi:hypothetical protein